MCGVKRPLALRCLLVILLPLASAGKFAIPPENPLEIRDAIVDYLSTQNFDVTFTDNILEYLPAIKASSGGCHLYVAGISPLGHEANVVRQFSEPGDHIFYVFRGAAYPQQPVRLTIASYLWFRFLRELGFVSRVPPVLAVISSCEVEHLPWNLLGSLEPN